MFVETASMLVEKANRRGLVNTTEIVKVWEEWDETREFKITGAQLRDGEIVKLGVLRGVLEQAACQVVPAQPGFELLKATFCPGPGQEVRVNYDRQPIIGWRIRRHGPEPVVVDDFRGSEGEAVIRYPDGQVFVSLIERYKDEHAWRAAMEERRKRPHEDALRATEAA